MSSSSATPSSEPSTPEQSAPKEELRPLAMVDDDPYLKPYSDAIKGRFDHYQWLKNEIKEKEGGLEKFSRSYEVFGLHATPEGISYREWAPGAQQVWLWGDFCNWDPAKRVPCTKDSFGVWTCFIPKTEDGKYPIEHHSKVKAHVKLASGEEADRVPAWIFCTSQDGTNPLDGRFWNPEHKYVFENPRPHRPKSLKIYESHVGMSSEELKVNSYREFADNVLPYIKDMGYNAVELMAIMEHAYYASFGYHVTNFFSIASRCGLPSDLQYLVDKAHGLGLVVIMDVVHSHASKNVLDGLNCWDGTGHQYFHEGARGNHDLWDSRLFNYSHWEVLRFLLSNLRYFMEMYQFDGFRFDGVSSMLYLHHGLGTGFSGGYHEYFGPGIDVDCLAYLTLANDMLHSLYPDVITIAEDVSGMPGMCRRTQEGGIGFDYRLGMAIPDKWIELLKKYKDDDWDMGNICFTLTNRRYKEAVVAYCESHDQALVGDKTIAFWLMDKDMYDYMSTLQPHSDVIERGIALHKMIRLITIGLGGEAYLTFMGNEFGHPEWIDFPREGNKNSFHYCRRQWNLMKDPLLKYKFLSNFEKAMNALEEQTHWLASGPGWVSRKDNGDKVISFERGGLFFVFNFHPVKSFTDYRLGVMNPGKYTIVLDSDDKEFGGQGRQDPSVPHISEPISADGHFHSIMLYLPCRTAIVLKRE
ncbi:glycoside hydrolase [Monocercomonoides exilis]|uniref:glycoside hydrolase n=1 Tax=Monocercomonoides exilis TaxID=2049356 RepID=UPI00355ABA44|nr:glycoside hydrolase [Monocercomonoides exilis]|eukprot:MONOS_12037.1-p1 / transcript=MONOS_12037.1 / gene=MONOS_12037 / organism=Monocercomonoides_exilis_PA203 / gene_product=glycoside hydrolase / transcript_product=glycoside hydrolase / location=Mono_scaffold00638:16281-18594(-) / protein_length=695 / sequence_SO=supercontig / SO=protein_coding / is_pseudo=false